MMFFFDGHFNKSDRSTSSFLLKRARLLTQLLIFSGSLNIILFLVFLYDMAYRQPPALLYEHTPVVDPFIASSTDFSNKREAIRQFQTMSFEQLVERLNSKDLVEDGYMQRDLALACLVNYHHFDIESALSDYFIQKRAFFFEEGKENMVIFPGLGEEHYQTIAQFIRTERWPLTSKGLFLFLKEEEHREDFSLAQAFFLSPEYSLMEMLLTRSDASISKDEILRLVLSGDWEILSSFFQEQRSWQNLSSERRQNLLLDYIEKKSESAASLILKTDRDFALRKLDDERVLSILRLLEEKTLESQWFIQGILLSPRSDEIWKAAARNLYKWEGKELPLPYNHALALKRFGLGGSKEEEVLSTREKERMTHIVLEGDSLWRIAKIYGIGIEKIKEENHLSSDCIKPGTILRIPRDLK